MKVKTALFSGGEDILADPTDVEWIRKTIKSNIIGDFYFDDYTHVDFIWALNAPTRAYNFILDLMKQY